MVGGLVTVYEPPGVLQPETWDPKRPDFGRMDGGKKVPWLAVCIPWIGGIATDRHFWPVSARLFLLAVSRMDRHGHAPFGPGEIQSLLGRVDRRTGEPKPASDRQVRKAVEQLRAEGLICDDSSVRCVRVPLRAFQYAIGPDRDCSFHR